MPNIVRDFIPTDKTTNPTERARFQQLRSITSGGVRADFVPGPDHALKPPSGRKNAAREALDRALARQAGSAREEFQGAVKRLRDLNVAQTIEHITKAPTAVQEMTLVAEALHGNRKSVLERFAPVDPEVVARWEAINAGAPSLKDAPFVPSEPEDTKGIVEVGVTPNVEDAKE